MKLRILISAALLAVVAGAFMLYVRITNLVVYDTATKYLQETAQLYAGTFKVKFADQLYMLESQARYFLDVDMTDYAAVKQTILSTKGVGEFKRISVAPTSGMTINSDGHSSGNILLRDFFKGAMRGEQSVSSSVSFDEDGEAVLSLAVPIFQKGMIVGAIIGTLPYTALDEIFSVDTFNGNGYAFLAGSSGKILVDSKNENSLCTGDNWLDFLVEQNALSATALSDIQRDILLSKSGMIRYRIGKERRVLVYVPLGINDWYVLSAATADYIETQQQRIAFNTLLVILIILTAFALCVRLIFVLSKRNASIEKANELFLSTNESAQSFLFEFSIAERSITFTGNTDFIFGEDVHSLPQEQFSRIERRLHKADFAFFNEMRMFIYRHTEQKEFTKEIRILRTDNSYAWFRISANRSEDGKTIVGKVTNVNEQVIRELELKEKAETDLLSGLLNKVSLENHVTERIKKNDMLMGAFYIIDLDNFKQVNDRIGHSMGDMAICDASAKLKLVFSERDYIARIGGDEFCVFLQLRSNMLPNQITAVITEKARSLCAILEEDYNGEHAVVHVTASIGVSLYPQQAQTYKELFKKADAALYQVKRHGKNDFAIYEDHMGDEGESVYA